MTLFWVLLVLAMQPAASPAQFPFAHWTSHFPAQHRLCYTHNRGTFVWWQSGFFQEGGLYSLRKLIAYKMLQIRLESSQKCQFAAEFGGRLMRGGPGGLLRAAISAVRMIQHTHASGSGSKRVVDGLLLELVCMTGNKETSPCWSGWTEANRDAYTLALPDLQFPTQPLTQAALPTRSSGNPVHQPACPTYITSLVTSEL